MSEKKIESTACNLPTQVERELTAQPQSERTMVPAVDIYETAEGLTLMADLPGVESQGVDVRIEDNVLTIQGKARYQPQGRGLYSEFVLQDYQRQFKLGKGLDQEKIQAQFKQGVLTVQIPKHQSEKPRKIEVSVA